MQDIHTHLYWESYDVDRDAVIARAHAAGVDQLFVVGCTVEESRHCVALAEHYPEIFASVGIHPHEMNHLVENPKPKLQMPKEIQNPEEQIQEWIGSLRQLAKNDKVIAIGECGLDYYIHQSTNNNQQKTGKVQQSIISDEQKIIQKEGFLAQMRLAQELNLPLIVHCRPSIGTQDAYEDMFQILSEANEANKLMKLQAILHCYMGDTVITEQFLTLPNVYFSFAGNITYPTKKTIVGTQDDLTETVKLIPLERLLAETDCPFLAPQSHRGERNEPAYVKEVVERIAWLRDWETTAVTDAMHCTVENVFFTAKNGV